ncbi:MAG: DUF4302 domain-containing protein [Prevotellaceae bacterium]|jgi:hypothetical protein|nr:DUF4302 domain-containing protein [Prevotellaceae bacterium]
MKTKILTLLLAASVLFTACDLKEDYTFDETPDERLIRVLEEYSETLTSAPNGWMLSVNTEISGGFTHWVTFDKSNRVVMLSDLDATWIVNPSWGDQSTSVKPIESSYRLKAMQLPSLIFDTYTYIHLLADPQAKDNEYRPGNGGAVNGEGLKSDFEFYFQGIDNGKVYLRGRYYNTLAVLTPATPEEAQAALSGDLKTVHEDFSAYLDANFVNAVATVNDQPIWLRLGSRSMTCLFSSDTRTEQVSAGLYLDMLSQTSSAPTSNMYFFEPIEINGVKFTQIRWQDNGYHLVDIEGKTYPITDAATPPIKLRLGPGKDYIRMRTNDVELAGTMKDPFLTNVYVAAYNSLFAGNGGRKIQKIEFTFGTNALGLPVAILEMTYQNSAGTNYIAKWWYKYEFNSDGSEITFTDRDQSGSSNENGREEFVRMLVDYFCYVPYTSSSGAYVNWVKDVDNIQPYTFKIDWIKNETLGSSEIVGGLERTDDPGNIFPGILLTK